MKHLLGTLALAAAASFSGGAAHAGLVTFDNPGLIDIDNDTFVATYAEAGFVISGPATSFLPIDGALVGGFDETPFTFSLAGGGSFGLKSFDLAPYDLGFGPGTLFVAGLLGGVQVASRSIDLTGASSLSFDAAWGNLTSVSFSGTGGFALDNITTVPEPGTFMLAGAGLLLVGAMRRRPKGSRGRPSSRP